MEIHGEAQLGKAYDARLMRRLWTYVHPYRVTFALAVACMPVVLGCSLLQPYLLKVAIDRCIAQGLRTNLAVAALVYVGALVGEFFAYYWQYYFTMLVAQRSLADLRVAIFRHVQRLPIHLRNCFLFLKSFSWLKLILKIN